MHESVVRLSTSCNVTKDDNDDDTPTYRSLSGEEGTQTRRNMIDTLKREPPSEEEAANKYRRIDELVENVAEMRKAIPEAEKLFTPDDDAIPEDNGASWFPYSMAVVAIKNTEKMERFEVERRLQEEREASKSENEWVCAICCEGCQDGESEEIQKLDACGHSFHKECWDQWSKACCDNRLSMVTCPLCRAPIERTSNASIMPVPHYPSFASSSLANIVVVGGVVSGWDVSNGIDFDPYLPMRQSILDDDDDPNAAPVYRNLSPNVLLNS